VTLLAPHPFFRLASFPHSRDKRNDSYNQLDKPHRGYHFVQPRSHLFQIRNMG
jgi:hypothetical protein